MNICMKICLAIFITAWVLGHGGCATFKPPSIAEVPFQERAQAQQKTACVHLPPSQVKKKAGWPSASRFTAKGFNRLTEFR
jgi:hypothetical protein